MEEFLEHTQLQDTARSTQLATSHPPDYDYHHDARAEIYGSYVRVYFGVLYTIGCAGVLANACALLVILRTPSLRRRTSMKLIINQSVCDLLASVTLIVTQAVIFTQDGHLTGSVGAALCRLFIAESLFWACFVASTFNLLAVTFERYLMVVFPWKHRMWFTKRMAYFLIAVMWLAAILLNLPFASVASEQNGSCQHNDGWSNKAAIGFHLFTLLVTFVVPLIIIIYSYTHILYVLYGRRGVVHCTLKRPNAEAVNDVMTKAQLSVTKTMMVVSAAFILCLSPFQVYYSYLEMALLDINFLYYYSLLSLCLLNCVVNPFIYVFVFKAFKKEALKLLCCKPRNKCKNKRLENNSI